MVEAKLKPPSQLNLLKIPSGEAVIIGRMYVAEGEGPHPTVLLLHGFPGVMLNLDLAYELQQNGWNALVINYRGSWGSQGDFTFLHSLEDVQATIQYIKQKEVSQTNKIDCERIALIGNSFGGFLALKTAALDPSIRMVASLSGMNLGLFVQMIEQNPNFENQIKEMLNDGCFFLKGAQVESLMEEVLLNKNEWNTFLLAPELANRSLLLTTATFDEEAPKPNFHDPLVSSLEQAGAKSLVCQTFETDHSYNDKRKELASTLYEWLQDAVKA